MIYQARHHFNFLLVWARHCWGWWTVHKSWTGATIHIREDLRISPPINFFLIRKLGLKLLIMMVDCTCGIWRFQNQILRLYLKWLLCYFRWSEPWNWVYCDSILVPTEFSLHVFYLIGILFQLILFDFTLILKMQYLSVAFFSWEKDDHFLIDATCYCLVLPLWERIELQLLCYPCQ